MPEPFSRIADFLAGGAGIDWGTALGTLAAGLALAATATAGILVVAYYLRHGPLTTSAADGVVPGLVRRLRRLGGTDDRRRWLCRICRSWNPASTTACYRGCGPRDVVGMLLPDDAVRMAAARPNDGEDDDADLSGGHPATSGDDRSDS